MAKLLINSDLGISGVYKAILLEGNKVYIPGITNFSLSNGDGTVNMNSYEEHKDALPTAWFCAFNRKCTENELPASCWVTFECGDVKRPIILGFQGRSIKSAITSDLNGEYSGSGGNGSMDSFSEGKDLQGGKIVDAKFTAYYPADNSMEGGFKSATGETLDYTKNTCAVPHSPYVSKDVEIPYGTYIKVMNTGSDRDNVVYRANDCGSAIKIENGVYHFDLLMKDAKTCTDFGVKYGKAMIGGTLIDTGLSNSDSSSTNNMQQKLVEFAKTFKGGNYGGSDSSTPGYCQAWVADVYKLVTKKSRASKNKASDAGKAWGHHSISGYKDYDNSSSLPKTKVSDIPIGACIWMLYSPYSGTTGHAVIYIGNGMVVGNNGGSIVPTQVSLQHFADQGYKGFVWGWNGEYDLTKM